MIAEDVLYNRCHVVIFFEGTEEAQGHDPDIRLFQRTCQFWPTQEMSQERVNPVYTTCISDYESARKWAEAMKVAMTRSKTEPGAPMPNLANRFREAYVQYGLREIIIVDGPPEDMDSDELGALLIESCAGYFHRQFLASAERNEREGKATIVGITWGWGAGEVVKALDKKGGLFRLERQIPRGEVMWIPLVGNLTVETTDLEAAVIASRFQELYKCGRVESKMNPLPLAVVP